MLHRFHNLVHKFVRDTWNNALGIGESPLESAEGDTSFLRGNTREQLREHESTSIVCHLCKTYRCDGRKDDGIQHSGVREVILQVHVVHLVV